MKEAGLTHWLSPNTGATNSSGLNCLPAGYPGYDPTGVVYVGNRSQTVFFCSNIANTISSTGPWTIYLNYQNDAVNFLVGNLDDGFSIRVLKN
jgi:hypothetical protein